VTHRFRSISGLASRRRSRPVVERATFVIISLGPTRLAVPVEWVERVLRSAPVPGHPVSYGQRQLPPLDMAAALGVEPVGDRLDTQRVLVMRHGPQADEWRAVVADVVHEVFAVETALLRPHNEYVGASAPDHPAVRGVFVRHECPVWVLDPSRLL
jgi:chemotaxis signal transduction protein